MSEIVAFLQNVWARDPARVQAMMERSGREPILRRLLFHGGLTGRRLHEALGDLCDEIYWEEITTEIGGVSSSCFPPDYEHIQRVLDEQQPRIIVTFGSVARKALEKMQPSSAIVSLPHPAARGLTMAELSGWREKIGALLYAVRI